MARRVSAQRALKIIRDNLEEAGEDNSDEESDGSISDAYYETDDPDSDASSDASINQRTPAISHIVRII